MLGNSNAMPTIAVKDLAAAKDFYGNTLGLQQESEEMGGVMYKSGGCKLFVYPSQFAGTNKATYMSWEVKNIEEVVAELKSKGVSFEQYDNIPETTREGAVHVTGDYRAAWFKDPDGNILSIGSQTKS